MKILDSRSRLAGIEAAVKAGQTGKEGLVDDIFRLGAGCGLCVSSQTAPSSYSYCYYDLAHAPRFRGLFSLVGAIRLISLSQVGSDHFPDYNGCDERHRRTDPLQGSTTLNFLPQRSVTAAVDSGFDYWLQPVDLVFS